MAKLPIIKYGDSILRKQTRNLSFSDIPSISAFVYDMLDTMEYAKGVGIAAPQVGLSLSVCIVEPPYDASNKLIMINPKIILKNNTKNYSQEGCLSLPGIYEYIHRFSTIMCEYINLNCENCVIEAEGLFARIIQHEVDHLHSKLFIDYLPTWQQRHINTIFKYKKQYGII
jgi:peptide deformylase